MPTEAPNDLRSRARYKIIDLLGIGQIGGLVNEARSVYLNDTPVQNADGSLNFKNFDISKDLSQLYGESTQDYLSGFPSSESEVSVGVKVTKDSPEASGSGDGSVTRTITDSSVDSARVTIRVPALTYQNTSNGNIDGNKIFFKIEVRESGGTYKAIKAAQQWRDLTDPSGDTPDGTTGIGIPITTPANTAGTILYQYRKKTSGVYGAWQTLHQTNVDETNDTMYWHVTKLNLEPGIYQGRAFWNGSLLTYTADRYLIPDSILISGKTTSPYDASYIVPLPAGGAPWDIKVSRITDDNTESNIQDDLYWYSYTEIVDNKFYMPNCAAIGINLNAEDFGGNLPTRSYEVFGRNTIKIPDNYDPITRTYTGVWTGTFTTGWTNNPAWVFYDLLTNKLYGLGDYIDADQVDKYALYEIAQYCDELVDTVGGAEEPRYTINACINSQIEAYELLNSIASAFRGMIYWAGGSITASADMPTDPIIDVGPANVINGEFNYQGSALKARHTVARVSWNNPEDSYKLNVEIYEDEEAIRKYGYHPIDVNAYGCTSRGLARRWGKWIIKSDLDAPDTITYKASFDHFARDGEAVRPGDVIRVYDPSYSGIEYFGRVTDVIGEFSTYWTITLDREITFPAGDDFTIRFVSEDGAIQEATLNFTAETTTNKVNIGKTNLPDAPMIGSTWAISTDAVEPRQWRVFSVTEPEPNIYQVSAMLYDPNKYAEVESNLNFDEASYTAYPSGEINAPTGLDTSEFLRQSGSSIISCVTLSWTRPDDPRAELFEVQYQIDGFAWQSPEKNIVSETSVDIFNTQIATYNFRVRAVDSTGLFKSDWTNLSSVSLLGKQKAPEDVTGFSASIEKFGILLEWNPVSDLDIDYYEIRSGASWAAGTTIGKVNAASFKYEDLTTGAYTFWIKAKDTSGNYSDTEATTTATISGQSTPTIATVATTGGIELTISGTVSRGFSHYEIQRRVSPSGSETTINDNVLTRIFTDSDITTLGYSNTWQYRVRAVDQNDDASAWSGWSVAISAKQIGQDDIVADEIYGKCFSTAQNVGASVDGISFNSCGLQAWCGGTKTVDIPITGSPTFSGTITANAGNVGGFTIDPTEGLYAGSGSTRVQMKAGAGFWAGATSQASAPFSVNQAGSLTSNSGCIGGWSINSGGIYKFGTNECLALWSDVAGYCSHIRMRASASAGGIENYITIGGSLYDSNGWTNGEWGIAVRAADVDLFRVSSCNDGTNLCAQIAGWNFNANCLYSNNILIDAAGHLQTADFVAGNKGWCIGCTGDAEFNNITARGAIKTAVFIKDEISVVGGKTLIRPATTLCADDMLYHSPNYNYVEDESQFAVNDIVRIKSGTCDYWGIVTACVANRLTLDWLHGCCSSEAIYKGQALVNYGSCLGAGGILLDGQCPYIDIYTHSGTPWSGTDSRVRLGNLNGWGSFASDTYGIAVGCPTSERMTYDTASSKLSIVGDIEVQSTGNILSDPAFEGVEYHSDYTVITSGAAANVGDYTGFVSGSGTVYGAHKLAGVGQTQYIHECSNALWLQADNTSSYAQVYSKNLIPVKCGATYTYSAYVAKHSGYADPKVYIGLCYYDCDMNSICYDYPLLNGCVWSCATPTRVSVQKTMPSNAAYVKVHLLNYNPSAQSYVYISALQLEEGTNLSSWKANKGGTISADHVKSGCLTSLNWNGSTVGSCINMNDGHFNFGGGKLTWDGSTLTTCGTISSCAGDIGGWNICDGYLNSRLMTIRGGACPSINMNLSGILSYIHFGQGHYDGFTLDDTQYGISFKMANNILFRLTSCQNGSCLKACIAGWNFNANCLYSGNLIMNSSGAIQGNYTASCAGWCISCDGSAEFNDVTVRGTICSSTGCIAGWNFNANCLYSGNLIMNSAGSLQGNYTSGSCGWCISCDGNAEFNNGSIGSFCIYRSLFISGICHSSCVSSTCQTSFQIIPTSFASSGASVSGSIFQLVCECGYCTTTRISADCGVNCDYAPIAVGLTNSGLYAFYTNGIIKVNSVTCSSDYNLKTDIQSINVLDKLRQMPITKWRFKDSKDYHVGPMAQDFHNVFCLGNDDKTVYGLDGIALKGVKELDECSQKYEKCIESLNNCSNMLESRNRQLEDKIFELESKINKFIN